MGCAPGKGHGTADVGRYRGLVEVPVREQAAQASRGGLHFGQLHERRTVLGHQDATFVQAATAGLIEVLGKQHFTGTDGVGGVGNDDVEFFLGGGDETHAVVDHQVQPPVVE